MLADEVAADVNFLKKGNAQNDRLISLELGFAGSDHRVECSGP
jgi:hypothetical protein